MVLVAAILVVLLLALVVFPTSWSVTEPFSGKVTQTVVSKVVPKAATDDAYVLKSSLIPCTCPGTTCPQHISEAIPPTLTHKPDEPYAAQAKRGAVDPEPIYLDYTAALKA